MTPAEIAALRERLSNTPQHHHPLGNLNTVPSADLRAALALLDAQAADLARLTAALENAQRDMGYAAEGFRKANRVRQMPLAEAPDA